MLPSPQIDAEQQELVETHQGNSIYTCIATEWTALQMLSGECSLKPLGPGLW